MAANNDLLVRLVLQAVDQSLRSILQGSAEDADRLGEAGDRAADRTDNLAGALQRLAAAAAALGLGALATQLIEVADQYLRLEAQIKLAVGPQQDFKKATADVIEVAMNARVPLDAVGDLYAKMARNSKELGLDQAQLATITETVARALVLQNAGAQESDSVIRQLSQALASGVLRGDEFNSIMEQSPRLLLAVADGLGVQSGALRTLAEDGMLTADQITKALLKQSSTIQKESAAMPVTVSQSLTTMANAWEVYIGQANQKVGPATSMIAKGIEFVAHNLESLELVLGGVAAGGLVKLAQGLTGIVARHQAAAAAAAQQTTAELANATATDRAAQAELGAATISQRYALQQAATARAVLDHAIAQGFSTAAIAESQAASVAANNAATAAAQRMAAADAAAIAAKERLAAATAAANARTGLLTGAMGLLGGPAGAVMLAVTAFGFLYSWISKNQGGMEGLNKEIDDQISKLNTLTQNQLSALLDKQREVLESDRQAVESAAKKIKAIEEEVAAEEMAGEINETTLANARAQKEIDADLVQAKGELDSAVQRLAGTAGKMGEVQQRLNEVTGQGADGTSKAAKSYVAIAAELGRAETAATNQTKAIEALTGAQEAWTDVAGRVVQALGSEAAQAGQAAAAAQQAATAATAVATAKQQELTVAGQQLAALQAEQAAKANLTLADQKQRAESEANLIQKKAAAEQAAASAAALDLEAAALQGVADYHASGVGTLKLYREAAELARAKVEELTAAAAKGEATQDQINQAILDTVRAESAYKEALNERAKATDAAIANAQRDRELAERTVQVKIDLLKAEQTLAKARGDEERAARIAIDVAELEVKQRQKTVEGLKTELTALEEKLATQQAVAQVNGETTDAEREALAALEDAIAAKKIDIDLAKAAVKERQANVETVKVETAAIEENTAAKDGNAAAAKASAGAVSGAGAAARGASGDVLALTGEVQKLRAAFVTLDGASATAFGTVGIREYQALVERIDGDLAKVDPLLGRIAAATSSVSTAGQGLGGAFGGAATSLQVALREAQALEGSLRTVRGYMEDTARAAADSLVEAIADAKDEMTAYAEQEQENLQDRREALEDYKSEGDDLRAEELRHQRELADLQDALRLAQEQGNRDAADAINQQIAAEKELHTLKIDALREEKQLAEETTDAYGASSDTIRRNLERVDPLLEKISQTLGELSTDAGKMSMVQLLTEAESLAGSLGTARGAMESTARAAAEQLRAGIESARREMESFIQAQEQALEARKRALEDYKVQGDAMRAEELRHAREMADIAEREALAKQQGNIEALRVLEEERAAENELHVLKMENLKKESEAKKESENTTAATTGATKLESTLRDISSLSFETTNKGLRDMFDLLRQIEGQAGKTAQSLRNVEGAI